MILCTTQECFKALLKNLGIDYDILIIILLMFSAAFIILMIFYHIYKRYFERKYCFKTNMSQLNVSVTV